MSEQESTLDEFVDNERKTTRDLEDSELIQGVAWSKIEGVPQDWRMNNIESDINILSGNNFSSDYFVEEGGIPLIRIRDLPENETTLNYEGEYDSKYLIDYQNLLVGMDGTFEPHLWTGPQALLNQRVCKIESNEKYNKIFFRYGIEKPLFYTQKSIAGTTVKHLSQSNINDINLPTPSLPEQRKIASVLYTVDQAIEKTEEIIDQVSRLKSGVVQDIFSEGYNRGTSQSEWFGPVPSEWDVLRLGDLADVTKLAGYEYTNDFDYNEEGKIIALRALNLKGNRLNLDNELRYITQENAEELDRSKLSEGDVAMTYVGAYIGESGYIPESNKFTLGPNVAKISPNEQLMGEYIHQALQTKQLKTQIKARQSSTGQPALSMSKIRKLEIPLPSLDEQQQIITLLKDFDRQYMHENDVIDQYQRLKQGLMQDLLFGIVRTTNTNIQVPDEVAQHG